MAGPLGASRGLVTRWHRSDRNGRIRDLDGLLAELRAAEIEVMTKEEWDSMGIGRFARIHDPEGNPVELWEPA